MRPRAKRHFLLALLASLSLSSACSPSEKILHIPSPSSKPFEWVEPKLEAGLAAALKAWESLDLDALEKTLEKNGDLSLLSFFLKAELFFYRFDVPQAFEAYLTLLERAGAGEKAAGLGQAVAALGQAQPGAFDTRSLQLLSISRIHELYQHILVQAPSQRLLAITSKDPLILHALLPLQVQTLRRQVLAQNESAVPAKLSDSLVLTRWRWLGPLSYYSFLDFDEDFVDRQYPLPESLVLQGKSLKSFQYEEDALTPFLNPKRAIFAAETGLELDQAAEVLLLVSSRQAYSISINGQSLLEKRPDDPHQSSTQSLRLKIPAGKSWLRLKYAQTQTLQDNFPIQIILTALSPAKLTESSTLPPKAPKNSPLPLEFSSFDQQIGQYIAQENDSFFKIWSYLKLALAAQRYDHIDVLLNARPELLNASLIKEIAFLRYQNDPNVPKNFAQDKGLNLLQACQENNPQSLLYAKLKLSLLDAMNYPKMAVEEADQIPNKENLPIDFSFEQYERLQQLGWDAEAERKLQLSYQNYEQSCKIARLYLDREKLKHRYFAYAKLPKAVQACPQIIDDYKQLAPDLALDAAVQALQTRMPNLPYLRLQAIKTLAQSEPEEAAQELKAYLDDYKAGKVVEDSPELSLYIVDKLRAQAKDQAALDLLRHRLAIFPSEIDSLMLKWRLEGDDTLQKLRKDGLKLAKEHLDKTSLKAQGSRYILDYGANYVFDDGASLQLTHQLIRVTTPESRDEQGEVYLPPNSTILNLRTIKAKTLETLDPEFIDNKNSISMPQLEVGDFVELEYLSYRPASNPNDPKRFYDMRFFFGLIGSPMDHSEYLIDFPSHWQMQSSGDVKAKCLTIGKRRQCVSKRENIQPYLQEPNSSDLIDLIPNIQYQHAYDWDYIRRNIFNQIVEQSRVTAAVHHFIEALELEGLSERQRAKVIYEAVLDAIVESEQEHFHDSASQSIISGKGSRMAVLKAIFDALNIPNSPVLIEQINRPQNSLQPSNDFLNYHQLYFAIFLDDDTIFLNPEEYFIPFDYLDPALQGRTLIPLDPKRPIQKSRVKSFEERLSQISSDFAIQPNGSATVKGHEKLREQRALLMYMLAARTENDPEQRLQTIEYSLSRNYGQVEVLDFQIKGLEKRENQLEIDYLYEIEKLAQEGEHGELFISQNSSAYMLASRFAPLATRQSSLLIHTPIAVSRTLSFQLPDLWQWESKTQENIQRKSPFGQYHRTVSLNGQTLTIEESLDIPAQRIETQDYSKFRDFCLSIDEFQRTPLQALPTSQVNKD